MAVIVLLVACANTASLLLARTLRRRAIFATRLALGATQLHAVGEIAAESIAVSLLGGGAGLLLAQWSSRLLGTLFLPAAQRTSLLGDGRVLGFTLLSVVVVGLLITAVPASYIARRDIQWWLRERVAATGFTGHSLRKALIFVQAGLSLALLIGAGLFIRSVQRVRSLHLGYDVDPVLYVELRLRGAPLAAAQQEALRQALLDRASRLPEVSTAARVLSMPFMSSYSAPLFTPSLGQVDSRGLGSFELQATTPNYFSTLGTRILRGRGIDAGDRPGAPLVVVVSDAMPGALAREGSDR